MTPLGVKTCGESEFDIFEAKKRFPDSGKACVLKQKVVKNAILPKNASIHRPFLNRESVFLLRKCQIRIPRMFLSIEMSFTETNFHVGGKINRKKSSKLKKSFFFRFSSSTVQ
jgi:hypothetical protein